MNSIKENLRLHTAAIVADHPTRHAGSEGDYAAADYVENRFRELGLTVFREEYPVRGWRYRSASFVDLDTGRTVPGFTACYFSGSCDAVGSILVTEDLPSEDTDVTGRICFCRIVAGVFPMNEIAEKLERRGAAAVIFISTHCQIAPSTKQVRSPFIERIATLSINAEGAFYISYYSDHTYHLTVDAEPYDTVAYNVIGRREGGDRKVVFGAHYDGAPLIPAAADNAAGTAVLLETARLFADYSGDCTLDFVAFSAEEYIPVDCPPGSADYVARHGKENIILYMNYDDHGLYFSTEYFEIGNAERLAHPEALPPYKEAIGGGDDKPFMAVGIPTVWLCDDKRYRTLHTVMDTIETCDFDRMAAGLLRCRTLALTQMGEPSAT